MKKVKPFLPAHSMSKLRTRSGAILCQSPSAEWLMKSFHPISTSYWQKDTWSTKGNYCTCKFWNTHKTRPMLLGRSWSTLPGHWESVTDRSFSSRTLYFPLGSSTQQHPTTSVSTINLETQQTILKSYACYTCCNASLHQCVQRNV